MRSGPGRPSVVVAALAAASALAVAACVPPPPPPASDADNATPGVEGNEWGWFEAGREWRGDFPDPHVVRVGSTYYAYASPVGGRYLPVLTSSDLVRWYAHPRWTTAGPPWFGNDPDLDPAIPVEIRASAMSDVDKWNMNDGLVAPAPWGLTHPQGAWIQKDLWAPGIIKMAGTWYAYYAIKTSNVSDDPIGRYCIAVASAPSPLGPFRDVSGGWPVVCDVDPAGSIDPSPFYDPVTRTYHLLWKAAGKVGGWPSALKAAKLDRATGRLHTSPGITTLLTTNEGSWEGSTIENPSMIRHRDVYYLFYSGSSWLADANGGSWYGTGYASCPQGPRGPCRRYTVDAPLLRSLGHQSGMGGASAFVDTAGHLRLAYHYYWLGENRPNTFISHPRRLAVVRLVQGVWGSLSMG